MLIALGWVVFRTAGNPFYVSTSLIVDNLHVGTIWFEPRDERHGFQAHIDRNGVRFDFGTISAESVVVGGNRLVPR
jgi:hypothetical protein